MAICNISTRKMTNRSSWITYLCTFLDLDYTIYDQKSQYVLFSFTNYKYLKNYFWDWYYYPSSAGTCCITFVNLQFCHYTYTNKEGSLH